jgi:hypothetical protein
MRVCAYLGRVKERLQRARYKTHLALCVWKVALGFFINVLAVGAAHPVREAFELRNPFLRNNITNITTDLLPPADYVAYLSHESTTLTLFAFMCIASGLCYFLARFACKVSQFFVKFYF